MPRFMFRNRLLRIVFLTTIVVFLLIAVVLGAQSNANSDLNLKAVAEESYVGDYAPLLQIVNNCSDVQIIIYSSGINIKSIIYDATSYSYNYQYNPTTEIVDITENPISDVDINLDVDYYELKLNKNGFYKLKISADSNNYTEVPIHITHIPLIINTDESYIFDTYNHPVTPKFFSHSYQLNNDTSGIINFETLRTHLTNQISKTYSNYNIVYTKDLDTSQQAPLNIGDYTAKISLGSVDAGNYIEHNINLSIKKATPYFYDLVKDMSYAEYLLALDAEDSDTEETYNYFDTLIEEYIQAGHLIATNPINKPTQITGAFEWENIMPDTPAIQNSNTNPLKSKIDEDGKIQFYQEFKYPVRFTVDQGYVDKDNYEATASRYITLNIVFNPQFTVVAPNDFDGSCVSFDLIVEVNDENVSFSWESEYPDYDEDSMYFFLGWLSNSSNGFLGNFDYNSYYELNNTKFVYNLTQSEAEDDGTYYIAYFTKLTVKLTPVANDLIDSDQTKNYTFELDSRSNSLVPYYGFNYTVEYSLTDTNANFYTVEGVENPTFDLTMSSTLDIQIKSKKNDVDFSANYINVYHNTTDFFFDIESLIITNNGTDGEWDSAPEFNINLPNYPSAFLQQMELYIKLSNDTSSAHKIINPTKIDDYTYTLNIPSLETQLSTDLTGALSFIVYCIVDGSPYGFEYDNVYNVVGISSTTIFMYDKTSPTLVIARTIDGDKTTYNSDAIAFNNYNWGMQDILIEIQENSNLKSGVKIFVKTDTSDWTEINNPYSITINDENLSGTYYYKAISGAGLESDEYTVIIKYDKSAPTMSYVTIGSTFPVGWTTTTQHVKILVNDISGVQSLKVYTVPFYDTDAEKSEIPNSYIDNNDGTYTIMITSFNVYSFELTDLVGLTTDTILNYRQAYNNVQTIQMPVDSETIEFKILNTEGYYDMSSWTSDDEITLGITTRYSPVGLIVEYSIDYQSTWNYIGGNDQYSASNPDVDYDYTAPIEHILSQIKYTVDENTPIVFRARLNTIEEKVFTSEGFFIRRDKTAPIMKDYFDTSDDKEDWISDLKVIEGYTWTVLPYTFNFKIRDVANGSGLDESSIKISDAYNCTITKFDEQSINGWTAYQLTFDINCIYTEYTLAFSDNAGNLHEFKFTPTIDYFNPSTNYTIKCEVGENNYDGSWVIDNDIDLSIEFYLYRPYNGDSLTFSYKIQGTEKFVTIETINDLSDSSITSTNKKHITVTLKFSSDINATLEFYIKGRTFETKIGEKTLKIDKNAPILEVFYYYNQSSITESEIKNTWRANNVDVLFSLTDYLNNSNVSLYGVFKVDSVFAVDLATDPSSISGYITTTQSNDFQNLEFDDYRTYFFVVYDEAKHITTFSITPLIDNTTFDLEINLNGYMSGDWINTDVQIDLSIVNQVGSLPSSGGQLEYYYHTTTSQTWTLINNKQLIIGESNTSYYFKCQTPSGLISVAPEAPVIIKVDKVQPTFHNSSEPDPNDLKSDNQPYESGSWTYSDVDITLRFQLGISGGNLYIYKSTNYIPDISLITNESWELLTEYTSGNTNYTRASNDHNQTGYIYYKLISNASIVAAYLGYEIKFDPTTILVSDITLKTNETQDYTQGSWTSDVVKVSFSISMSDGTGESGIYAWYRTSPYGNFEFVDSPISISLNPSNSRYEFEITSQSMLNYRITINTGAGRSYTYFRDYTILYDPVKPNLSITKDGTLALDGSNWYTSKVTLKYVVINESSIISQLRYYYRVKEYGSADSNYIYTSQQEIEVSTSVFGGKTYVYEMYVENGAGVKSDVVNPGSDVINGTNVVKIDQSLHYLESSQLINGLNVNYATFTNVGYNNQYKRGDTADITITCNTNAYIKSIDILINDETKQIYSSISKEENELKTQHEFQFTFKYDIVPTLRVVFYRKVDISLTILKSYLQSNLALPQPSIPLGSLPTGANHQISIKFSSAVDDIGVYDVGFNVNETWDEYLILTNAPGHEYFTVVYFRDNGTNTSPYQINNETDLQRIADYEDMNNAYLGNIGSNANYIQTADITITKDFSINSTLTLLEYFSGKYQGNDKQILFKEAQNLRGLFYRLKNGAEIYNLGIKADIMVEDNQVSDDSSNIGLLAVFAGEDENSQVRISGTYTIGSIVYKNAQFNEMSKTVIAGLVASTQGYVFIDNSMSYVNIEIDKISNNTYLAGLVGTMASNGQITNSYVASQIEVLASTSNFPYVANIANITSGISNYTIQATMLNHTIFINNVIYQRPIVDSLTNVESSNVIVSNFDSFLENESLIGNTHSVMSIMNQMSVDYSGTGHTNDPFIITNYSDLVLLDAFPYAAFKQITNIQYNVNSDQMNHSKPFAGKYNALRSDSTGAYSIIGFNQDLTMSNDSNFGFFGPLYEAKVENITFEMVDLKITVATMENAYLGVVSSKAIRSTVNGITLIGDVNIKAEAANSLSFIGGAIGVTNYSEITNSLTLLVITVEAHNSAVVGGIIGQAENGSSVINLVSLGSMSININDYGYFGSTIGNALSNVYGSVVYGITNSLYVNGYEFNMHTGGSTDSTVSGAVGAFESIINNTTNILIAGAKIENIMNSVSVFEGGAGTQTNPYQIANFKQLLEIENRMYARYRLVSNIVIGDLDNDGSVDEGYVFDSIGNYKTFTGELNGANHTISALNTALFYSIQGTVRDVRFTVNIKVFTEGDPDLVLTENSGATVIKPKESVVLGIIARYSLDGSNISTVIISGSVTIKTSNSATGIGINKVTFGGIVGIALGGRISNPISNLTININAISMDVGAVCGEIVGAIDLVSAIILSNITAKGSKTNVGFVVGAIRAQNFTTDFNTENIDINANMTINGETYTNRVGVNSNLIPL
ncbi:MAG: hypothetical protein LBF68_01875 [Christensenellaceae bacterium]|jgi:hypothetical protein|nr:hypothetical protein [Christensenellaceae bacterium]